MKKFFLPKSHCHACTAVIPAEVFFCRVCGRSRGPNQYLQFKAWELLLVALVSAIGIASFGVLVTFAGSMALAAIPKDAPTPARQATVRPADTAAPTARPTRTKAPTPDNGLRPIPAGYRCTDRNQLELQIGAWGRIRKYDVNLRSDAVVADDNIIRTVYVDEKFRVIDGPKCAEGGTWWKITTESGTAGWSREMTPSQGRLLVRIPIQ